MPDFISPLGLFVRGPDKYAAQGGAWNAARSRDGRPRLHEGIDLVCVPGTPIVAPFPGYFVRMADPYPDTKDATLSGLVIRTHDMWKLKVLYCKPLKSLQEGSIIRRGEIVGTAQSLQHLYPGITDHVHVELYRPSGERIDPTPWFFGSLHEPPPPVTT